MQRTRHEEAPVNEEEFAVTLLGLIILSGVGLMIAAMMNRRSIREMEHRERLAMIDRGLLPSPESDPGGFESGAGLPSTAHEPGVRYRTAGVMMIGLGLGLTVLLTFTADSPGAGVGLGGGAAILGGASLLNYFLIAKRHADLADTRRWNHRRPSTPEPPKLS
jgi:hypothetical protein